MKINIETKVEGHFLDVYKAFDLQLFEFLKPKGAKMEIIDFTGSKKGDTVRIRFIRPVKTDWISEISEDFVGDDEAYFIDQGTILPWPLSSWKHKHLISHESNTHSIIKDQIEFKTISFILDYLIWPIMYIAFALRKPLYKKYFKRKKSALVRT